MALHYICQLPIGQVHVTATKQKVWTSRAGSSSRSAIGALGAFAR